MAISNQRARDAQRIAQLAGAAALGTSLYSPRNDDPLFTPIVQWGVLPGQTISGALLCHRPRQRRMLHSGRAGPAAG